MTPIYKTGTPAFKNYRKCFCV